MEHQDTKLTSMRPRLKELNDNPYFIWSYTEGEVNEESFNRGLKQTLNINTPMFQNDTENLSLSQIEMLKAISNGETKLTSAEVKRRYSLGNPNTITKNKLALTKRDILDNNKGTLTFVDPLYRLWLKGESIIFRKSLSFTRKNGSL